MTVWGRGEAEPAKKTASRPPRTEADASRTTSLTIFRLQTFDDYYVNCCTYAFQPSPNAYWDGNLPFPSKSSYPWSKPSPWHTRSNVSIILLFISLFVLALVVRFYYATALYGHLVPALNLTDKIKIKLSIFFCGWSVFCSVSLYSSS